jgi:hypothetical protein
LNAKVEEPYGVIGSVFFLESILKEHGFWKIWTIPIKYGLNHWKIDDGKMTKK